MSVQQPCTRAVAYHERREQERAHLEEIDVEGLLATELRRTEIIVRVKPDSIVIEAEGPNYVPTVKRETKKARRARQQQQARQKQAAAALQAAWRRHLSRRRLSRRAAAATATAAVTTSSRVHGRLSNRLYDGALEDEEDDGEAGITEAPPLAPVLDAHAEYTRLHVPLSPIWARCAAGCSDSLGVKSESNSDGGCASGTSLWSNRSNIAHGGSPRTSGGRYPDRTIDHRWCGGRDGVWRSMARKDGRVGEGRAV